MMSRRQTIRNGLQGLFFKLMGVYINIITGIVNKTLQHRHSPNLYHCLSYNGKIGLLSQH